jgi:hypothetical protein
MVEFDSPEALLWVLFGSCCVFNFKIAYSLKCFLIIKGISF